MRHLSTETYKTHNFCFYFKLCTCHFEIFLHDCPNLLQIYYILLYHHHINTCGLFCDHFKCSFYTFFFYYSVHQFCLLLLSTSCFQLEWLPDLNVKICQMWSEQKLFKHRHLLHLHIYKNLHVTYKNGNSEANTFHLFTCKQRHEIHETKLTTIQVWS